MSSIDVIIPTFGRLRAALALAPAIAEQLNANEQVLIVIQQETLPQNVGPQISVVASGQANLPAARNRGIALTSADLVLFLDDDVTIAPGLISAVREAFADPAVGAVAGFVDDPLFDRTRTLPSTFVESTGEIFQNFTLENDSDTISVMGANMAFRRTALQAVRGFDEHFRRNALWEDIDISFRLTRAGWKLRYCAGARVIHHRLGGGCRSDQGARYLYHQFANTAYFASRFMKPQHRHSWLHYWKYRLEYLSRTSSRWPRHDPAKVGAGICGALAGIVRYGLRRLW